MQAASISDLKKILAKLDQDELLTTCLRLARFKKENKELLTYLLFLAHDEVAYARYLCSEIDQHFDQTPKPQKVTVRKIIRWMDKCLRYSGNKETEAQVRLHFCQSLNDSGVPYRQSRVMHNMYLRQVKKIHQAIEKLHEDLRFDFRQQLSAL